MGDRGTARTGEEDAAGGSTGGTVGRSDDARSTDGDDARSTDGDDARSTDGDDAGALAGEEPVLTVVCGLPGVGKTTVARRVAERLDATVLRTDAIRKELFPDPEYTEEESAAVYAELADRAATIVEAGDSVVLDATFARAAFREDVAEVAAALDVPFRLIKVECAEPVVEERIEQREGLSDADFEVHLLFKEEYEPLRVEHAVIDNSGSEAATRRQVDTLF